MLEQDQDIEQIINGVLTDAAQKNAATDFFAYLRANGMRFERGKGYWEDKFYWLVKYKNEYVCFVLVNGSEDKTEQEGWTVWSDDSDSSWYADPLPDKHASEVAWRYVDICGNCGGCKNPEGTRKTIFGKHFNNVCITTMKFINPDPEALACMKAMVALRKNDILSKQMQPGRQKGDIQ